MDFHDAVTMMKSGVPVSRTGSDDPKEQFELVDGQFLRTGDGFKFPTVFFSHEVLATDWEVVRIKQ
jgi:hypothetical protein